MLTRSLMKKMDTDCMKQKIVISLHSPRYRSLFYETGAFTGLESKYKVIYLQEDNSNAPNPIRGAIEIMNPVRRKKNLTTFLDWYSYVSMLRYRDRSKSFALKFENNLESKSWKHGLLIKVLAMPLIFEIFNYFFKEIFFPTNKTLKIIRDLKPDFLVVVSNGTSDGISMDLLAAANKLNIKSMFLMYNWDNITCKGVYPFMSTYAGVWGEQSAAHFFKIHRLPMSNIFILGSPQFMVYERFEHDASRKDVDILERPRGQLIGAYLGGARYRDDIFLLKTLDPILQQHNIHLIYRPHPFQDRDMVLAGNFFDEKFTNITMDLAIIDHYKRCRHEPGYDIKSILFKYENFASFLFSLDFVISSYSTMSIESMIMGKPVLLTAYSDPTFKYSFDKIKQYEHHDCWPKFTDVVECNDVNHLEMDIQKLLTLVREPVVSDRLKKEVKVVSYSDMHEYSTRLLWCVNKLLSV